MRPETATCAADALLAAQRIQETLVNVEVGQYEQSWQLQSVVDGVACLE